MHPPHCALFKTKKAERRKKLYQMEPFADPVKEKERQRAISAKVNREKKKGAERKKRNQLDQLKLANRRLSKEAVANRRKLVVAKREIKLLRLRLESSVLRVEM